MNIPLDQLFLDNLKEARRQEILRTKGKPKMPKFPNQTWAFPVLLERKYVNHLVRLFSKLTKVSKDWAKTEYPDALKRYQGRSDAWGYHADEDSFGIVLGLRQDLEAQQEAMDLGPGGTTEAFVYGTGDAVAAWNAKRWATERAIALGHVYDPYEPWMSDALEEWTKTDLRLIKNLSDEYIKRIETSVLEAVQTGRRPEDLYLDILKTNSNLGINRAKLIASDQTSKLLGLINQYRSQALGLEKYKWLTARDERVRPTHKQAEGKIGIWNDSTKWVEDGKLVPRNGAGDESHPGHSVRCRCTSASVWDDLITPIDQNLLEDPYVQEELRRMGY